MSEQGLYAHLKTGCTTVCHLWRVERTDGVVMGFTDHDETITLEGVSYKADSGLTARALQQTTGLSVDNSEAFGALSSLSISETDIAAGRYDKAEVTALLVNWRDRTQRVCLFRGHFGEIVRVDGTFKVELRGLTDLLNQPQGRTFQRTCSAILGDGKCRVDLSLPDFVHEEVLSAATAEEVTLTGAGLFAEDWFAQGTVEVLTGAASGIRRVIKSDVIQAGQRVLTLWEPFPVVVEAGELIKVRAGCDRQMKTCRTKFDNLPNFRGFPHIPGDDWITSYPVSSTSNTGGSRYQGGSNEQ